MKPEQAMKKLVWSETNLQGPQSFAGKLPQPPSNNGPIRNLITGAPRLGSTTPPDPTYYGDSAVIAFRTPPDESDMKGKGVGDASRLAGSSGHFFFVWTLLAIGVLGLFTAILSARGLWSLPWRRSQ